jgi:hypothetical protein
MPFTSLGQLEPQGESSKILTRFLLQAVPKATSVLINDFIPQTLRGKGKDVPVLN